MIFTTSINKCKTKFKFVSGIYFHGELEKKLGYDLVQIDSKSLVELDKEHCCYPISIPSYDGHPVLFNWKADGSCPVNTYRGLIIEASNVEDLEFAVDAFKNKRQFL